jgi:flagellar motility protein MotE (MotC chaperone)
LDSNAVKLLSQETNKVNLEYLGTDEKIKLTYDNANNTIVIEYGGTKLTIDSNVKIGKIVVDESGLKVYDQDGNIIARLDKDGRGTAFIEGMTINFDKGANVTLKGGGDGKIGTIEVTTAAGTYKIEKIVMVEMPFCTPGGGCRGGETVNIRITTPNGDTFTFNPKDFNGKSILIRADGSALMKITGGSNQKGAISIKFDSTGKASSVTVYDAKGDEHEISLSRDGAVMWGGSTGLKLNLTVNADLSVSIGSDVANSVRLNFKQDGSIEAVKPDGTIVPIQGDIKNATFHDDGSLAIGFKDGSIIIINPGDQKPPLPDGWDTWTPQQRGDWLKQELLSGDQKRIQNAQAIFGSLTAEDQASIIDTLIDPYNPDVNSAGYKVMNQLFKGLDYDKQLGLLKELSKDRYYPTAATHILQNLDASTRNKLFVDLAKADPLAASRIIAHWPTGLNTPEGYEMFGALLDVDKDAANAVLAALDADPVRAYFAKALRDHFNLPDAGWWDGMTVDQINSTLQGLVDQKKLDEAVQKLSELAKADSDLAAQVMGKMKTITAAEIVNKLDLDLAANILNKMDANTVAQILTARPQSMIEPWLTPPVISTDKAGQILAAMDKSKAADVLEAMKPGDTIPIIKAMLNGQGVQVVADIMKLMDPKKVAAIMAVRDLSTSISDQTIVSGHTGLTVKECADILKAMGGLKDRVALKILINLFRLNTTKAIAILRELLGRKIPA